MRAILLFIIGLLFGGAGGFLAAGGLGDTPGHDHAGHSDAGHNMTALTPWEGPAPYLSLALEPDMGEAFNLKIIAPEFTFAPEQVNGPVTAGTGHAHIYVNGEKVARAYGPWMLLEHVKSGDLVRVTLNANDHSHWGVGDTPLATEITIP